MAEEQHTVLSAGSYSLLVLFPAVAFFLMWLMLFLADIGLKTDVVAKGLQKLKRTGVTGPQLAVYMALFVTLTAKNALVYNENFFAGDIKKACNYVNNPVASYDCFVVLDTAVSKAQSAWPTLDCSELDLAAAEASIADTADSSGSGASEWWQSDVMHPLVHHSRVVTDDVFKYECYYLLEQTISSWLDALGNALGTIGTVHFFFEFATSSVMLTGDKAGMPDTSFKKRMLIGLPTIFFGSFVVIIYIYEYFIMTQGKAMVPMPSTADCFIALWFGGGVIWLGLKITLSCCYSPALIKGREVRKEILEKRLKDADFEEVGFEEIRQERRMSEVVDLATSVTTAKDTFKGLLNKTPAASEVKETGDDESAMGFGNLN